MLKEIINSIKNIEIRIKAIMFFGFDFSFVIAIISALVLLFYILNPTYYLIYESGIILFKTSLSFAVAFFICAIVTNNILKETN